MITKKIRKKVVQSKRQQSSCVIKNQRNLQGDQSMISVLYPLTHVTRSCFVEETHLRVKIPRNYLH